MKNCFLILLMISLIGGCGTYCIKLEKESWGAAGEICYSPEQSKIEGSVVFVDSDDKKIIGMDENDVRDIIAIIESGKKLWDFSKDFFGMSIIESPAQRLNRILQEYKKYIKEK